MKKKTISVSDFIKQEYGVKISKEDIKRSYTSGDFRSAIAKTGFIGPVTIGMMTEEGFKWVEITEENKEEVAKRLGIK